LSTWAMLISAFNRNANASKMSLFIVDNVLAALLNTASRCMRSAVTIPKSVEPE
jgi:hypothetical protein